MRDCESGKAEGKLIATQGRRDTEEIVISMLTALYKKKSSENMAEIEHKRQPKVVIISSQNKRIDQIKETIKNKFIKAASDSPFKLFKGYISPSKKQKCQKKDKE